MGTVRDNHKTLLLTTKKVLPDQRLFPLVPSHCYTCAHTNTHMHTSIHIWSCPRIHTCTHMQHMNVISWAHEHMITNGMCLCTQTHTVIQMLTHAYTYSQVHMLTRVHRCTTQMGMHIYANG